MAFRGRRRFGRKGRWLETQFNAEAQLVPNALTSNAINYIPILKGNAPFSPATQGNTLAQLQQFTHLRTVGDAYYAFSWANANPATQSFVISVHAGIAVITVDEAGAPLDTIRWDPESADSTDMQWMFKRSFNLLMPAGAGTSFATDNQSPSAPLGSWVDCKSRRAMRAQTDLFWVESFGYNNTNATTGVWQSGPIGLSLSVVRGLHLRSYLRFTGMRR